MIFLSHSEKDKKFVYRVFSILYRLKLEPFMYEEYPDFGENIPLNIKKNIKNCDYFVVFLTKSGVSSQWVNQEIGIAEAFGKKIIPVQEVKVTSKGFVQLRNHIKYNPNSPDETIYGLLYKFRPLYNCRTLEIECPVCLEDFYMRLHSFERQIKDKDKGILWEVICPKRHKSLINPKTLELYDLKKLKKKKK
jgi:hypothetical protein